jgi:hypothetical protein
MNVMDGEAHAVTEVAVSGNAALVCPAWSPDGQRLAFSTIVSPAHMDGRKPQGQQDVWTVNSDGTNRHRLTDGNGINASPFWGVDGRVYFVSDRGGTECVWSTPANAPGTAVAAISRIQPVAQVAPQPMDNSAVMTSPMPAMQPSVGVATAAAAAPAPARAPAATSSDSSGDSSMGQTDDTEIGH